MPRIEDLTSILGPSALSGRWVKSLEGSLRAAWSSSSVSFFFTGTRLSFQAGHRTGRQPDMSNGGTPMISIRVGPTEDAVLKSPAYWRTADPEPNSEVLILDETTHPNLEKKTFVQIMLIDWSSLFELSALIYDDVSGFYDFSPFKLIVE
jgi:hypothetical protein